MRPVESTWHARFEWELAHVEDIGRVVLPDGVLAIGDVAWSFEGIAVQIDVGPGEYTVRRAIARTTEPGVDGTVHQDNAAVAMLLAPAERVDQWESIRPEFFVGHRGGFWTENGVVGYGAPTTLQPGLLHNDYDPGEVLRTVLDRGWLALDGERGNLICFTVGPQHQECLTWKAVDTRGEIVAVLTDLGLVDHDPPEQTPTWL